jgi:hypothetical protein
MSLICSHSSGTDPWMDKLLNIGHEWNPSSRSVANQKPIHKYIHIYRQTDTALNIPIRIQGCRKWTSIRISGYIFYIIAILSHTWGSNEKFWEELIAYFSLIRHGPHRKRHLQNFSVAVGTILTSCYLTMRGEYTDRNIDSPLIKYRQHRKWRIHQFFYCCVYSLPRKRVYLIIAQQRKVGYILLSRCLATKRGIHIQRHRLMGGIYEIRRWNGIRSYDMHTKFHKDCIKHWKSDGGGHPDTESWWLYKPVLMSSK